MSEKDAKVRLELAAGGLLSMLKEIETQAKHLGAELEGVGGSADKADKKVSPFLASLKKGAAAGKTALTELGSSIKSTLSDITTLGGALSVGMGARAAVDLVSTYKDLAFQISNGTGQAVEWTDVQKDVEGAADRWKQKVEDVAGAYRGLYDQTGDAKFAAKAADAAAMANAASGKGIGALSSIAGTLNEKFGITGDEIGGALASVLELSSKGGATIEELGAKMDVVGASAKQMGLQGQAGLQQVLGMLNVGDNVTGSFKKNLAAVTGLMETFGNTDKLKSIEKNLGIKITDKGGGARKDALDKILAKSGGKEEVLSKIFQGDTLKLVSDFGKTFQRTFSETEGTAKTKTAAALAAFHRALDAAGKTTLTAAQLEAQAKKRAATDPDKLMTEAMNRFKQAFTKPEMMASMEKLAQLLPKVTSGLTSLVEMAANHPLLAAGAFAAQRAGGAALKSVGGDALGWGAKKAGALGADIGKNLAAEAAKSGAWGAAGKNLGAAAGIAVAAAVAYELGKAAIDSVYEDKAKDQGDLAVSGASAAAAIGSGDTKRMAEEATTLKGRIDRAKKNQGGIGGFMDETFGGVSEMLGGPKHDVQKNVIAKAERDMRELEAAMAKGTGEGAKEHKNAARDMSSAATELKNAARALTRGTPAGGGGPGTNGLPPAPGNGSGSAPK